MLSRYTWCLVLFVLAISATHAQLSGELQALGATINAAEKSIAVEESLLTLNSRRQFGDELAAEEVQRRLAALFSAAPLPTAVPSSLRELRTDVLLPLAAPSPRLLDPARFDLARCCTFSIYVEHVDRALLASKHGFNLHFFDEQLDEPIHDWAFRGSSPHLTRSKPSACLRLLDYDSVWLDPPDDLLPNGRHGGGCRERWLRRLPAWDGGKNWIVVDTNDMGSGFGVHENGLQTVGDSVAASFRTDKAVVWKTAMTRGPLVCHPGASLGARGGHQCKRSRATPYGYRNGWDVAMPLPPRVAPPATGRRGGGTFAARPVLAFLKASGLIEVRQRLVAMHDEALGFIAISSEGSEAKRFDYVDTLSRSKFGLAPSGNGVHSFRLVEVMRLGAVVVSVTARRGEFVLPFSETVDWSKFALQIALADRARFNSLVKDLATIGEAKWTQMQQRSVAVYEHFLSPAAIVPAAIEIMKRRIEGAIAQRPGTCPST